MISIVACDPENLGVITDYDVVHHLAHLTHKVGMLASMTFTYPASVERLQVATEVFMLNML